jgi:murein DD-endopeptidase MepM/ murein hydrolase activator NlpD
MKRSCLNALLFHNFKAGTKETFMSVFRKKDWMRYAWNGLNNLAAKVKQPRNYKEILSRLQRGVVDHKLAIIKTAGAVTLLIGISAGGNQYIEKHTVEIFHVYVDGQEIGVVSDPEVIEQAIVQRQQEIIMENPDIHMVLDETAVTYSSERVFKGEYDNEAASYGVKTIVTARPTGVKLMVDGKEIAVLKNQEEAEAVLEEFKSKYANVGNIKEVSRVSVLSSDAVEAMAPIGEKVLVSVDYTQEVQIEQVFIDSVEVQEPAGVLAALESMGTPPETYIVQSGDCVGCIAEKFNVTSDQLRELNDWIVDDMIRVGDELIVKGFEPTLGVRTVEIAVEEEEIHYDTVYETDDTLRLGKTRVISNGKEGLKKVIYELTSINGTLIKESLLSEEVLTEPVTARVAKGTLKLAGEGSGKFAWPVTGAKLTSSFGSRWGTKHQGIDMASSNRDIKAADTGKVTFVGEKNGYGKTIIIDHQNGYETLYGHLSKYSVSKGDVVEKGDKIGVMGSTGRSTGVHLHFEVHVDGVAKNPSSYLSKK